MIKPKNIPVVFRMPSDRELTAERLSKYISQHKQIVATRLHFLKDAYENEYEIYHQKAKAPYKPDNRVGVNFARYIVDTMNGYFIGNPVRITSDDQSVNEYVNTLNVYNDMDDSNAEICKLADIFGNAYEIYFLDSNDKVGITYVSPMESFMIYDDSILERPLYFVRYYIDEDNNELGSVSNALGVRHFSCSGGLRFTDDEWLAHGFKELPASELIENSERQGVFESVLPAINAYNKALSEKANDVDYFADAYLKVIGARIEKKDVQFIRDTRIVNFGDEAEGAGISVEFMEKPSADKTQENLIDRLEKAIFQSSMVCNISDDNFATSSGIALKFKLQPMNNLAKAKERKFISLLNRRYRVIMGHALSPVPSESWMGLRYKMSFDIPANVSDEASVAKTLEGIVSKETQLSVLSVVENVQDEMERLEDETQSSMSFLDGHEHDEDLG